MQAWENFLETLRNQIGDETLSTWLRPLRVVHFDACNLYLEAQNSFQIEWFEEHIRPKAKKEFVNNNFRPIKIHLTCGEIEPEKKEKTTSTSPPSLFTITQNPLFDEFITENFLFNEPNRILSALLKNLNYAKEESDPSFNPIFLYGPPCTGKTHLLQAFAHEFKKNKREVLYVKSETFTENVVNAIRSGNMQEFRKAHRHVDVLIFDDVQHLAKKAATQEEFFHTFNTLHSQGKQIILSADVAPGFLQNIEARLISRFEWGLSLPIHKLEGKDLLQMLKIKCKNLHFPLPETTLKFLTETFSSSIKSLQRSVEALALRSSKIAYKSISPSLAMDLLRDLIEQEKKHILNPDHILSHVADFFDLNVDEILSKSQTQECAWPRQVAMFLCRNELKMPFAKIGEYFKRDHSTVMTSVKSIEERIKNQDKETGSALSYIKQKIQQAI